MLRLILESVTLGACLAVFYLALIFIAAALEAAAHFSSFLVKGFPELTSTMEIAA